jgi:phosphohistidine phosphatase
MTSGGHTEELLLWLLRHAKAATDPPAGGTDHERPLAPRGKRDATALGLRLSAGDLGFGDGRLPDLVLASTATRTTETASLVAGVFGAPVDRRRRLYYGTPTDVLDELRGLGETTRSVMVVGHNPTTHSLALELLAEDDTQRAMLVSFPTCALAAFRSPVTRWRDLEYATATLVGFARPPYDARP